MNVTKIALFASGSGTNAENIIRYFSGNEFIQIDSLWSNNSGAFALERAKNLNVATFIFNRDQFYQTSEIAEKLKKGGHQPHHARRSRLQRRPAPRLAQRGS